jgi:hypothetical protein
MQVNKKSIIQLLTLQAKTNANVKPSWIYFGQNDLKNTEVLIFRVIGVQMREKLRAKH